MKSIKLLGLSMLILAAAACTEKENPVTPKDPIAKPLTSVIAQDGSKEVEAVINHAEKTIKFEPFATADLAKVSVKFTVAEGAALISPKTAVAEINFTKSPVDVIVNNGVKDLTYKMYGEKVSKQEPIIAAGFAEDKSFGSLPGHIKVYKNSKYGPDKKETGYLVEVSKGATLGIAGSGKWGDGISFNKFVSDNKGWNVYLSGMTSIQSTTIIDGKMSYAPSAPFSCLAIENGKFIINPVKRTEITIDGAKTRVPNKMDMEGKVLVENWKPTLAFGGDYMVISDGKIMTREAMGKTGDCSDAWWKDDNADSRQFVGVNKAGDKIYLFICGNAKGGMSMKEVIEVMSKIGSWDAMCMEAKEAAQIKINDKLARPVSETNGEKAVSSVLLIK